MFGNCAEAPAPTSTVPNCISLDLAFPSTDSMAFHGLLGPDIGRVTRCILCRHRMLRPAGVAFVAPRPLSAMTRLGQPVYRTSLRGCVKCCADLSRTT